MILGSRNSAVEWLPWAGEHFDVPWTWLNPFEWTHWSFTSNKWHLHQCWASEQTYQIGQYVICNGIQTVKLLTRRQNTTKWTRLTLCRGEATASNFGSNQHLQYLSLSRNDIQLLSFFPACQYTSWPQTELYSLLQNPFSNLHSFLSFSALSPV